MDSDAWRNELLHKMQKRMGESLYNGFIRMMGFTGLLFMSITIVRGDFWGSPTLTLLRSVAIVSIVCGIAGMVTRASHRFLLFEDWDGTSAFGFKDIYQNRVEIMPAPTAWLDNPVRTRQAYGLTAVCGLIIASLVRW